MPSRRRQSLDVTSRTAVMAAVLAMLPATACMGSTTSKVIRIGVDLPLSGAEGRAGTPTLNGVQFFVHQHPSVDGFTVEIVARDDAVGGAHNAAQALRNIRALASDALVMGVIGP